MNMIQGIIAKFVKNSKGATFLEYTVLLGFVLVAGIGMLSAVAGWASGEWGFLSSMLTDFGVSGAADGPHECCAIAQAVYVPGKCCC